MPPDDVTGVKWLEMSNNVYHYQMIAVAMAADGRGWPRIVVFAAVGRPRKLPWQLPWTSADFCGDCRVSVAMAADGRGNCRGNCRGLPWVAMIGTTDFATDRTTARAVASSVAFAVEVP